MDKATAITVRLLFGGDLKIKKYSNIHCKFSKWNERNNEYYMSIRKKNILRVLQRVVKIKNKERTIMVIKQDFNQMVNDLIKLSNYNK